MSQRLPTIMFVVGLIASDIAFRLTAYSTYRLAVLIACVTAGVLYLLGGSHELIKDAAFPLVGASRSAAPSSWSSRPCWARSATS